MDRNSEANPIPTRATPPQPSQEAMDSECGNHLDFASGECPSCKEPVDAYGNTESAFRYCSFPDCGCDGARLCMAGEASERACEQNVEGMYDLKTTAQRVAVGKLIWSVSKEGKL